MTQAELDALPEDGLFGAVDEVVDGRLVRRPVLNTVGALYTPDGEPMAVVDAHGIRWMLGYGPDGVRYKRRVY